MSKKLEKRWKIKIILKRLGGQEQNENYKKRWKNSRL